MTTTQQETHILLARKNGKVALSLVNPEVVIIGNCHESCRDLEGSAGFQIQFTQKEALQKAVDLILYAVPDHQLGLIMERVHKAVMDEAKRRVDVEWVY